MEGAVSWSQLVVAFNLILNSVTLLLVVAQSLRAARTYYDEAYRQARKDIEKDRGQT